MPVSRIIFLPAVHVAIADKCERSWVAQRNTRALLDLITKPVDTAIINRVLEARMLTIRAIAKVTLRFDDGLSETGNLVRPAESEGLGEPRVRLRLAM